MASKAYDYDGSPAPTGGAHFYRERATSQPSFMDRFSATTIVDKLLIKIELSRKRRFGHLVWISDTIAGLRCQLFLAVCLLMSLYLYDFWVIGNPKEKYDTVLNVFLVIIFAVFGVEMILLSFFQEKYFLRFFFFMDLIGTFSILLDLTWWAGERTAGGGYSGSSQLARAARVAKIAARAGRLPQLRHLLKACFPGLGAGADVSPEQGAGGGTQVSALSQAISRKLSKRVAAVVMVQLLLFPLLEYQASDAGPGLLLASYAQLQDQGACGAACFQALVDDASSYYDEKDDDIMIINIDGVGTYEFDTGYTRDKNMKKVYGDDGTSYVALSQTYSAKVQAAYNIAEITIVILLLVWFSISFTQAMDKVIVAPMERIMARLRVSAHSLMANVKALDHVENVDVDELEASLETDLLEQVLEKLVALVRMASPHAEEHVFRDVGLEQENTVMQTYVASQFTTAGVVARERRKKDRAHSEKTLAAAAAATWLRALSHRSSEDQGLTDQGFRAMLETWDFDALSATDALLLDVLHHLFAAAGAGAALQVTQNAFDPVFAALKSKYLPNPYHNWRHGVDVCFATFQLARAARSRAFVSPAEQACLLLAALAHDAGHPGLNNAFLVNTQNKLAVTYNDVSPLENMHSSVLFEILKEPETNVLVKLDKETFTSVRKLMVQAILGTDMKSHFAQINQINALQEKHGGEFLAFHAGEVPAPECLRETSEHKLFLVEMLLHSADISGPVKPPAISKAWADLVIQEFFAQGEEEKSLGMHASPMMDKDTTNIPNMQMGFIEFVVSPLYFGMARLFPDMAGCLDAMLDNHGVYRVLKEEEIRAQGGDAAEEEVAKLREKAAGLAAKVRNLQELRSKTGKSNQNQVGKEDEGKKEEQLVDRMEAGAGGQ